MPSHCVPSHCVPSHCLPDTASQTLPPRVTPTSSSPLGMHVHVHVHRYMFYAMAHVTEDFLVPALNPNPQP